MKNGKTILYRVYQGAVALLSACFRRKSRSL